MDFSIEVTHKMIPYTGDYIEHITDGTKQYGQNYIEVMKNYDSSGKVILICLCKQ